MADANKTHRIMFVCKANSTRSQMAEGWATVFAKDRPFKIVSSGLKQTDINPKAVEFMADVGVDISSQYSKALSEFKPEDFDVVISLCGCGTHLPPEWAFKGKDGKVFEDWNLTDPVGLSDEVYSQVRDRIKDRVIRLLDVTEGKLSVSEAAKKFVEEDLEDNKKNITIYSRTTCPYCLRAKALLKSIPGLDYQAKVHIIEVDLRTDELDIMEVIRGMVGKKSTPQIWICQDHVGGCDDLHALHDSGELTSLLKQFSLIP